MRTIKAMLAVIVAVSAMTVLPASAQQPVFYPAKGQTPDQLTKDQGECANWATQQSGYNPNQAPAPQPKGGVARGAAKGAAVGAVAGAIGGDAGQGAGTGAGAGAVVGGVKQRQRRKAQDAQTQQANTAYANALSACMQGRGYTVK